MKWNKCILLTFILAACQAPNERRPVSVSQELPTNIIRSFLGEELPGKEFSDQTKNLLEQNLLEARQNLDAHPDSLELIIWYGRRLAYLGRYHEAIQAYTEGLAKYPNSHRLRRHRGHRYITTRQIDKSIKDFELAAFHSKTAENSIEPDGIPNRLNKPLSNDKFNIWYHFGLAHYLNGRFDKAVSAYKKCLAFSDNDDLLVATSYWLYLSAKRIGNEELAGEVLSKINSSMKLIENQAYFDLLKLYQEEIKPEDLLKKATDSDNNLDPTLAYGIGNWYIQNNLIDEARNIYWRVLAAPNWDAFGYIATEADIQNMATSAD